MSSVQEELISDLEGENLDAQWYARRESEMRVLNGQHLQSYRAAKLRELTDLDKRIESAKRAGKNTSRMTADWLRLFHEYEAVCRQINGSAA